MDKQKEKQSGNKCLFLLYNIFNILFLMSSLLVMAMGAWLWTQVKGLDPFNIGFILIGAIEFVLSLLGQHVKKSYFKLNCYLFLICIIFISQICLTSIGIASQDKIIDWAANQTNSPEAAAQLKDLIKNNVKLALTLTLAAVVIQFFCMCTVYFYRRSFIVNNESHEFLIKGEDGKHITLQEKQKRDKNEIISKYDKLREEQKNKFKQQYKSTSNASSLDSSQDKM